MTASNKPKTVILTFNHEDGSWWAESDQMESLFAGGDSLDDAKELARQAVVDECGESVVIAEWMPVPGALTCIVGSPNEESASAAEPAHPREVKSWPDTEDPSQSVEPDLERV